MGNTNQFCLTLLVDLPPIGFVNVVIVFGTSDSGNIPLSSVTKHGLFVCVVCTHDAGLFVFV
jgi:hypothetical protein